MQNKMNTQDRNVRTARVTKGSGKRTGLSLLLAVGLGFTACGDEYALPVRPIGVNGQEPWNVAAKQFMYAPTFGFEPVAGAAHYRFTVEGGGVSRTFDAERPTAPLTPVWPEIPAGNVVVTARGVAADGKDVGLAGKRTFWKMAPFAEGTYPRAARGYAETARMIWNYIFNRPYLQYLLDHGEPDKSYPLNSYPAKMLASQIWAMLRYATLNPDGRERAMRIARLAADRLIARAEPATARLAFFPQTYDGRGEAGNGFRGEEFAGQHMLHYPAAAGTALIDLAAAGGGTHYRDFAVKIADTYVKTQEPDGTWTLKMRADGTPVCPNRLMPIRVIAFLERVAALTGSDVCRAAAERAFAWIERHPLRDWHWEGQFEDIHPAGRFANLTKHGACDVAIYLLKRFPGDARRLAQARELLRFSEDQFVVWNARYFRDDMSAWVTPTALEQYHCYEPIDESAAKLMMTYLALYRAERNPRDLAKARAIGDAFTRVTKPDGRLPTWWHRTDAPEAEDWVNGQVVSAFALEDLATFGETGSGSAPVSALGQDKIVCAGSYGGHLQGVATDGESIFWSFTVKLVKTDLGGRVLTSIDVPGHHGDLCVKDGLVYVAVNLGRFNFEGEGISEVRAYAAKDLKPAGSWKLPMCGHGAGGMTVADGRFFVVGGLPATHECNYVYEFAPDFTFIERHELRTGFTLMGIQTAAFEDGRFLFGIYGCPGDPAGSFECPRDFSRFVRRLGPGDVGIVKLCGEYWTGKICWDAQGRNGGCLVRKPGYPGSEAVYEPRRTGKGAVRLFFDGDGTSGWRDSGYRLFADGYRPLCNADWSCGVFFPKAKLESGEMLLEGGSLPCPSGIYCRAVWNWSFTIFE